MTARYTIHQLHVFAAVAERASFSRAAADLHLTQPTVSMQVKQLAETLGVVLFEGQLRGGGAGRTRVRLTAAGHEVLEAAREVARAGEALEERLAALAGVRRGRVRVCAASTAEYFVPRLLGAFQQAHPGVEVELQVQNRQVVTRRLADDADDLYIMTLPPTDHPVVVEAFADNPLVVVAPAKHPLVTARKVALAELAAHDWVLREEGAGTRLVADSFLAERGVRLSTRLQLGSNEAVKQAVIGGFGLAILSLHALRDELLHHRRVRIVAVEAFPIPGRWHWVLRTGRRVSPAVSALQRFAAAQVPTLAAELAHLQDVARRRQFAG